MRRALLAFLVILIVLGGYMGVRAYQIYTGLNKITGRTVTRATDEPTVVLPSFNGTRRLNFLLLGSDNDQKKEEAAPLTQSMIVITVDPVNNKVGILSVPRDFWVPIPGHGYAKIDLAFKYGYQEGGMDGGVRLARQTVERLFGIPIDYYGWVGLSGFQKVIDTFNGVTIDVQHPVLDDTYPNDVHSPDPYGSRRLFIPAGWQHMDGQSALEYVRSRHGDIHGDFGRSQRQQQVLLTIRQKVNALNVLTKLPDLISELQGSVRTDLTAHQLYDLEALSHRVSRANTHRLTLQAPNYAYATFSADGQYILQPYWKKVRAVVKRMFAPIRRSKSATPGATSTAEVNRATATPGPSRTAVATVRATPVPSSTSTPASMKRLPGSLIYVSTSDGVSNIYELQPGGSTTQLTYSGDGAMPQLSPDGHTLAFVRFTNGLHKYDKYASDIWLMDMASRKQHVITHDESRVPANDLWAAYPSWSSNGRTLLFASDRAKLAYPPSDARETNMSIWSMSADGSHVTQLTSTNPLQSAGGDADPSWRPGTHDFLYVHWAYPNQSAANPGSQLILENATTHVAYGLTAMSGGNNSYLQPAWSRDGTKLAYLQRNGTQDNLVIADIGTSKGRTEVRGSRILLTGKLAQPSFSSDGRWISVLKADGDTFSAEAVDVRNGSVRTIPGLDSQVDARWRPVWAP